MHSGRSPGGERDAGHQGKFVVVGRKSEQERSERLTLKPSEVLIARAKDPVQQDDVAPPYRGASEIKRLNGFFKEAKNGRKVLFTEWKHHDSHLLRGF